MYEYIQHEDGVKSLEICCPVIAQTCVHNTLIHKADTMPTTQANMNSIISGFS